MTFFIAFLTLLKFPLLQEVYFPSRSWLVLQFVVVVVDSLLLFIVCSGIGITCFLLQPSQFPILAVGTFSITEKDIHSFFFLVVSFFLSLIEIQCCNLKTVLKRGKKSCWFAFFVWWWKIKLEEYWGCYVVLDSNIVLPNPRLVSPLIICSP